MHFNSKSRKENVMDEFYDSLINAFRDGKLKDGAAVYYKPDNAQEILHFEAFKFGETVKLISAESSRLVVIPPISIKKASFADMERTAKNSFNNAVLRAEGRMVQRADLAQLFKTGKHIFFENNFFYYHEKRGMMYRTSKSILHPIGCLIIVEFNLPNNIYIDFNSRRLDFSTF